MTPPPRLVISDTAPGGLFPPYVHGLGQTEYWDRRNRFVAEMHGFVLQADPGKLQDFCNRVLNPVDPVDSVDGAARCWKPEGSCVLLIVETFTTIMAEGSCDPLGGLPQQSVALWFPIRSHSNGRAAWAVPYLFVDSPTWLCEGRETFGFPSQLATFTTETDRAGRQLRVCTQNLATYHPRSRAAYLDVIRMTWDYGPGSSTWSQVRRAAAVVGRFADDLEEKKLSMVVLKQFRDAADSAFACYQRVHQIDKALVGGGATPQVLTNYEVEFPPCDGEAIERSLGRLSPSTPPVGFKLDYQYTLSVDPQDPAPVVGSRRAYVEKGGEIVYRHPAKGRNAQMYGFAVEVDPQKVDDFCDRMLNEPSQGTEDWMACSTHACFNFVHVEAMGSADRLDEALGTVDEMEFAVWVPVFDRKRHRVAWVIPYMFVNTQLALCGGRETYGFPKRLGRITIDDSNHRGQQSVLNGLRIDSVAGTGSLHAACAEMILSIAPTPGSPATLSQLPRGSRAAWIEIGRRAFNNQRFLPPIAPDHSGLANALACVVDQIIHPVPVTGLIGNVEVSLLLAGHMATGRVPMVFLNQFRDAVDPKFACYQAIVEVNNRMTRFGHGGFLDGSWNVTLGPLAGARLEQELGVSPQPQRALAAFWLDFDFVCGFEGFLHPTFGIG